VICNPRAVAKAPPADLLGSTAAAVAAGTMYKMAKKSDRGVEMSATKIIASDTRQLIKTLEEET
jgi:molybdenum cofactor biosynthesis enzyme